VATRTAGGRGGEETTLPTLYKIFQPTAKKSFGRWQKFVADTITPKTVYKEGSFITFHFTFRHEDSLKSSIAADQEREEAENPTNLLTGGYLQG
jgi:hypothetical protein